jgi:hypothetical protein|tara:strand:- start:676 stop:885 length:210 start_codon:yes stop_codon:yes gene_type:complete
MPLRKLAKVRPISDRAKLQFAEAMNNNAMAYIEDRRSDGRTFFSSEYNGDFWFWSDGKDDPHWRFEELV